MKRLVPLVALLLGILTQPATFARAGSYGFADDVTPNAVAYPPGYTGANTGFTTTICLNPSHPDAAAMGTVMENLARTYTDKIATSPNLTFGAANNVPSGSHLDFESVALHELGHCLGLGHTNLGTAVASPNQEFTNSYEVAGGFNFDAGTDGIDGSFDDDRDDDLPLVWFFKGVNNPFVLSSPVDSTTWSRNLADLPPGHLFPTAATRDVAAALGYPDTEAVMKQLSFGGEAQRNLSSEDVATLQFAQSGLDETAGTSDDFTYSVSYVGLGTQGAGCNIEFQSSAATSFARCSYSATGSDGIHWRITSGTAQFNPTINWFYNDISNAPAIPLLPNLIGVGLLSLLLLGTVGVAASKRG